MFFNRNSEQSFWKLFENSFCQNCQFYWIDISYSNLAELRHRGARRGTEVPPGPVVWCLTSCCTSDPAAPSLGECDWSNPHRAALAGHSIESYTFKLYVLAYRCIHGSAPSYLARFFTPVSAKAGRSQLQSAVTGVLFVPRSHTSTIDPRAFAISSPLLGTASQLIFVIPAFVFFHSGKTEDLSV